MPDALHHLHKRKRIYKKLEKYPHPHSFKRFVDHVVYIFGILAPFMGSLQAHKIYSEKTAAGVSSAMFSFMLINNIVWFLYGYIHREKPIMIMYTLWFFVNAAIVVGTIMYS
jgi:MtN3 and saliva related transmembrane protein